MQDKAALLRFSTHHTLRLRHDVLQEGPRIASGTSAKNAVPSQEEGVAGGLGSDSRVEDTDNDDGAGKG